VEGDGSARTERVSPSGDTRDAGVRLGWVEEFGDQSREKRWRNTGGERDKPSAF